MTRGLIGLPLKPVHGRNALVLSAIQEERASLENPLAIPVANTGTSSSSCGAPTTTSSSSSDSSPDQSQPVDSAATARATKPQSARSRSVLKLEEVQSTATNASQPLARMLGVQSARTISTQRFIHAPMISVKALKSVGSKVSKLRSAQTHSIPCAEEPAITSTPPKKITKASSARSRPVTSFDDSHSDETTNKPALKTKEKTKTAMSLRSRPLPCFNDLLASPPILQEIKETRKPHVGDTRSTSSPTALNRQSKSSASPSSSWDEELLDAERHELTSTPTAEKRKLKRPKSFNNLTSKATKQNQSHHPFLSEHTNSFTCKRASFDESQGEQDIAILGDTGLRPRSFSDSVSVVPLMAKGKSPSRLRHYEGKFQNRRGQSLLYFSLFPPKKMPMRGIVLHLHGMGDHCRRNTALYKRHCKEGFGVITYDLLNHGKSDNDKYNIRAHISNFNDFVDDTNDFITFAKSSIYKIALRYWRKHHHPLHPHGIEKKRETQPELPLIISGASFGSLIGIHTVLSGKHKFHAAVWASPSIGVTWTPVLWAQWKFARALIAALPTAKVIPAIQHNFRSRDPVFLKKYQNDPLTCSDMITPRSGYQSLHAMMRLQREKRVSDAVNPFCGIPMLFLAGSEDHISDQQASIKFYSRMESLDKDFKLFEGLYHMIYEEPEKEDVFKYLVNWLHERFPLETRHPNKYH